MADAAYYQVKIDPAIAAEPALLKLQRQQWRQGLLVRTPNWLGDCLMSLPALYSLRRLLPEAARLAVLCRANLAPFWRSVDWVDQVFACEGKHFSGAAVADARAFTAGVGVVLPNSFSAALDLWKCRLPLRLGRGGRGRGLLLTHRLPMLSGPSGGACYHQAGHYLEIAAALAAPPWDQQQTLLTLPEAAATAARLGLSPERAPWLAVAPGAAYGPAKQWPVAHFHAVAKAWVQQTGGGVVAVGTAAEHAGAAAVLAGIDGGLNLAGSSGLPELMAVLASVELAVTNDSGAMHLAAALGCRGVAVFGSTDPVATGPVGAPWLVLQQPTPCAPCFARTCRRKHDAYACLHAVTPEIVLSSLLQLLHT